MTEIEMGPAPPPIGPTDLGDADLAADLRGQTDSAMKEGNEPEVNRLLGEQLTLSEEVSVKAEMAGQPPMQSMAMQEFSEEVNFYHAAKKYRQDQQQFDQVLQSSGYYETVQPFFDEMITAYRAKNEARLEKWDENLSEGEKVSYMQQFQPVTSDPNRAAEARQILAQIDAQLPEGQSVFTNPKTREIAGWLNREAGPETPGFMQSGEHEPELGVTGAIGMGALEFTRGWMDPTLNLAYGTADLFDHFASALTGQDAGSFWQRPTSYIRDPRTGRVLTNAGSVSPSLDAYAKLYAVSTGDEIGRVVAEVGAAKEWEEAKRNGFETILYGASYLGGAGIGYIPAGAMMGVGARAGANAAEKGLAFLGTLGKSAKLKGGAAVAAGDRALKITRIMGGTAGAMAMNGIYEGVAHGNHDGYLKAFQHGAAMAPVYTLLGHLGRRSEVWARKHMTQKAAEVVGGMVEGMGFGAMEINDLSPLWRFAQDPTEQTWGDWAEIMAKNMIGITVAKAMARTTPARQAIGPEQMGQERAGAREQAAKQAVSGDLEVRDTILREADRMGVSRETLTELGEVATQREALAGANPKEAQRLRERQLKLEAELDRQEQGFGEPDTERQEKARLADARAVKERAKGDEAAAQDAEQISEGLKRVGRVPKERAEGETGSLIEQMEAAARKGDEAGVDRIIEELNKSEQDAATSGRIMEAAKLLDEALAEGPIDREIDTQTESTSRTFPAEGGPEFAEGVEGPTIKKSDILREIEGRQATKGVRIPFTDKHVLAREGDPIQLPLRKGVFERKDTRGYIDQRQDLVRSKEAYDLNNIAHEVAHHMQKHLVGLKWKPGGEVQAELLDLGEPLYQPGWSVERKVREGWAEFWARDLLGDPDLHSAYPNASRALTEMMVQNKPLAAQYARIRDAYRTWREQGAGMRAVGEIEGGPGAKKSKQERKRRSLMDKVEDAFGRVTDDASRFKRSWERWMEISGNKAGDLPISMRPDKLHDAYRMKAAKRAEFLMNTEMTDFEGNRTGKSLRESMDRFDNPKEELRFWGYMKRMRELEMMDKNLITGVERADALAAVSYLETPKFKEVAADLRTWFHGLVDFVAEAGGFDAVQAAKIKNEYLNYLPFHRMVEGPQGSGKAGGERVGTGLKQVKGGSSEPILHPREAITRLTTSMISNAHRAHVSRAMYNNYVVLDGVGGLVTEVPRDRVPHNHPLRQIADGLDKLARTTEGDRAHPLEGAADVLRDLAEGNFEALTLFTAAQLPKGSKPIIAFTANHTEAEIQRLIEYKKNSGADDMAVDAMVEKLYRDQGKLKFLEIDKEAFETIASIEGGSVSYDWLARLGSLRDPVEKVIRAPTQLLRYFATGVSIPFAFRNMIRDAMAHQLYTKNGSWIPLAGFQQFFKGFGEAFRAQRQNFEGDLFAALGGQATTYLGIEIQGGARAPRVKGDPRTLLENLRRPMRAIEQLIGMTEQALRRREFEMSRKEALDKGATNLEANLEALYDAQEVTINFTRASSITRQVNGLKAYFNAGVQGNRKFVRTVLGYEGAKAQDHAIKAGLANLTSMSLLAYLWHGEEDWFKDLPEWRKIGYWNFRPLDDGPIVSIPKPHEPGLMFTLPMEKVLDELMDGNPVSTKKALLEVVGGYLNNFQFIPDIIAPGYEVATNFSLFRQRPIVPYWMEKSRKVADQYTAYTTRASRWIGEAVGVSPAKAEHFLAGYTGNAFLHLSRSIDELTGAQTGLGQEGFSGFGLMSQKPHKSGRAVDDLYALRKEIDQAAGSERAGLGRMQAKQRAHRARVGAAIGEIKSIRKRAREGKMDRKVADQRAFEIANRALNAYRRSR